MSRVTRRVLAAVVAVAAAATAACGPTAAQVAPRSWQRGASIYPFSAQELVSPAALTSLQELRSLGANYVTLVVPLYQASVTSSAVSAGPNTPSPEVLGQAIAESRAVGLNVMVKFHVDILGSPGIWRAAIRPAQPTAWFQSYGDALTRYAAAAASAGASDICLGVELAGVADASISSANTPGWIKLVRRVREVFRGKLTYDANWIGQPATIQFWNYLDYIGLSGYYPLPGDGSPASLAKDWAHWDATVVSPLAKKWNKKVFFTEVGYRSTLAAHLDPPKWDSLGMPSQSEQANDWAALFAYWSHRGYFGGVQAWQWYVDPAKNRSVPPAATDFAVQGKSAEGVFRRWFGGGPTSWPAVRITSPTPNESVSGTRRVSADLSGPLRAGSRAFWRVDGGRRNAMGSTDGRAFAADVDVSTWTWQPSRDYQLAVEVIDASGALIAATNETIRVG